MSPAWGMIWLAEGVRKKVETTNEGQYQNVLGCFWRTENEIWVGFIQDNVASGKVELVKSANAVLILSCHDVEQDAVST